MGRTFSKVIVSDKSCAYLLIDFLHLIKCWAGIEKVGLEDFQKGGFWKGELYIDNGKKIHKALDIHKVGILGSVKMFVTNKAMKDAIKKTKDTPGNLKGDGR